MRYRTKTRWRESLPPIIRATLADKTLASSFPLHRIHNRGQATVEFLLSVVFTIGFFFLFIGVGLYYATGYLAHYATYMAAREYLTFDSHIISNDNPLGSEGQAENRARQMHQAFELDKFNVQGGQLQIINPPGQLNKYHRVGVTYRFRQPLTHFSLIGGNNLLDLTSEAFLGREPARNLCRMYTCDAFNLILQAAGYQTVDCGSIAGNNYFVTLFDNGC